MIVQTYSKIDINEYPAEIPNIGSPKVEYILYGRSSKITIKKLQGSLLGGLVRLLP